MTAVYILYGSIQQGKVKYTQVNYMLVFIFSLIIRLNILAICEYEKDESVLVSDPRNVD
jgi:hypothetical protein